ncbi:MAG: hypothetical protein QM536_08605 [Chitinophagaceae bacterium]|nr:hypothetical protein [Chitinophagaceae bacterium]
MTLEYNKIYNGDCVELMKKLPNNSIDMVVTSPPYDTLRDYKGYTFDLHKTGEQIFRILKEGVLRLWLFRIKRKILEKRLLLSRQLLIGVILLDLNFLKMLFIKSMEQKVGGGEPDFV